MQMWQSSDISEDHVWAIGSKISYVRLFYYNIKAILMQMGLESAYIHDNTKKLKKKLNSMVWVRERTIPTERPPLVGEVIANLCG
jgi:hypothetical protein